MVNSRRPWNPQEKVLYVVFKPTHNPDSRPVIESYRPGEVVNDLVPDFRLEVHRTYSYSEALAVLEIVKIMSR